MPDAGDIDYSLEQDPAKEEQEQEQEQPADEVAPEVHVCVRTGCQSLRKT